MSGCTEEHGLSAAFARTGLRGLARARRFLPHFERATGALLAVVAVALVLDAIPAPTIGGDAPPATLAETAEPTVLELYSEACPICQEMMPVVEQVDGGYVVSVGSAAHPMADDHYIQWIELIADGKVYREHLSPGAPPEATFNVSAGTVTARAYCNLHGLWKS